TRLARSSTQLVCEPELRNTNLAREQWPGRGRSSINWTDGEVRAPQSQPQGAWHLPAVVAARTRAPLCIGSESVVSILDKAVAWTARFMLKHRPALRFGGRRASQPAGASLGAPASPSASQARTH